MNLIFDLDGTLIDSSFGIYRAYKESIQTYQKPLDKNHFTNYIETNTKRFISKTEIENLNEYFKFLKISY